MILQRAIPKFSLTFDKEACTQPNAKINHAMIYCASKPQQYSHFIVKALVEDWLRTAREPFVPARPNINMRFEYVTADDRDRLFHNGYSLLYLIPGRGPIVHWGYPGDVGLLDLMGMATIIKTFVHYYETVLKIEIAKILQSTRGDDHGDKIRCRLMVQDLFRQVTHAAYAQRVAYGRGELYVPPENTNEDEYFLMVWHHMSSRAYTIRVDFDNFDLKFTVDPHLMDLFGSVFGSDLTYLMVPREEK